MLANEVMTWCLCGNDMAHMVMTNGDVDWAHHLIRECHVPTLESVFPISEHTFHTGNATFMQWNDCCNGMLHAQSDLELSLCEKSLNLW